MTLNNDPAAPVSSSTTQKFFWGCLPFVATPPEVVHRMLELAKVGPTDTVIDLGCGDGRILLSAVVEFNARMAIGYEIRDDLIEATRKAFESNNVAERLKLVHADLQDADLSEATVIAIYLTGTGNDKLRSKFEQESRPGTRIVSHNFGVNGWVHSKVEQLGKHKIYLYVAPQAFRQDRLKTAFNRLRVRK